MGVNSPGGTNAATMPKPDLADTVEGGPRGLLVTLLNLFDTDADASLTRKEFEAGVKALGYEFSESTWAQMFGRFGQTLGNRIGDPMKSDELDLSLLGDFFRNKYDPLLEDTLRQLMRGVVSLASRVSGLEAEVSSLHSKLESDVTGLHSKIESDVTGLRSKQQSDVTGLRSKLHSDVTGLQSSLQLQIDEL